MANAERRKDNMENDNLVVQSGVMALLANIHRPLPYGVFTFKGDVCQMADAADVARSLGFVVASAKGFLMWKRRRNMTRSFPIFETTG